MLLSARRLLKLGARGWRGSRCDPRGGAGEGTGGQAKPAGCPQPPASPAAAAPAAAPRAPPSPPPHAAAAAAAARVVGAATRRARARGVLRRGRACQSLRGRRHSQTPRLLWGPSPTPELKRVTSGGGKGGANSTGALPAAAVAVSAVVLIPVRVLGGQGCGRGEGAVWVSPLCTLRWVTSQLLFTEAHDPKPHSEAARWLGTSEGPGAPPCLPPPEGRGGARQAASRGPLLLLRNLNVRASPSRPPVLPSWLGVQRGRYCHSFLIEVPDPRAL